MSILAEMVDFLTHRRKSGSVPPPAIEALKQKEREAEAAANHELAKLKAARMQFDTRKEAGVTTLHSMLDTQDRLFKEAIGER